MNLYHSHWIQQPRFVFLFLHHKVCFYCSRSRFFRFHRSSRETRGTERKGGAPVPHPPPAVVPVRRRPSSASWSPTSSREEAQEEAHRWRRRSDDDGHHPLPRVLSYLMAMAIDFCPQEHCRLLRPPAACCLPWRGSMCIARPRLLLQVGLSPFYRFNYINLSLCCWFNGIVLTFPNKRSVPLRFGD